MREVAAEFNAPTVDVSGQRFLHARGRLAPDRDFWSRLDRIARRLDAEREVDRSFADAMAANRRALSAADREFGIGYVEGFHAADTTIISERALAEGGFPEGEEHEQRLGRVLQGYGPLLGQLSAAVLADIRLGSIASRVDWRDGRVDVTARDLSGRASTVSARTLVVTVPLGVLAAPAGSVGTIEFDPAMPSHARAIELTAMGSVIKLVLQFKRAFWRDAKLSERLTARRLDQVSLIQSRERLPFTVWWTMYPVDAPLLTAWRGGPAAADMSRLPRAELEERAVASLAAIFAMRPATLRRELVATFYHDWNNDPFSRGVYSYSRVGGASACVTLSRAVRGTIWFAGEAADRLGRTGTVHGAIGSGWRAADEILRR